MINAITALLYNPKSPTGLPYRPGVVTQSSGIIQKVDEFNKNLKAFNDTVSEIWYYITHPILIWNGFMELSYWLLLGACIIFLLYYLICNDKKQLINSAKAFAIYFLLRLINLSLR